MEPRVQIMDCEIRAWARGQGVGGGEGGVLSDDCERQPGTRRAPRKQIRKARDIRTSGRGAGGASCISEAFLRMRHLRYEVYLAIAD